MEVKGITIHNTGNGKSARELYELLFLQQKLNICHYLVDENEVINTFPIDKETYHTGRGYDKGNMSTISIEICKSTCDNEVYLKAQKRAVKLIKKLMKEFKLSNDDIYFHSDFNNIKCPHRILEIYKDKGGFINECII